MKRTKIVCTIGPASGNADMLQAMVRAGMNVARVSCSHGDWETRREWIRLIREAAQVCAKPVGILLDLAGPKFRLGDVPKGAVGVAPGDIVTFGLSGEDPMIEFPLPEVLAAAAVGDEIVIADGQVSLKVEGKSGDTLAARVVDPGTIKSHQGVTLVGRDIEVPAITPQDVYDVHRGAELGVDWMAASFVHSAADMETLRQVASSCDSKAGLMAKVETASAVRDIDAVVGASDGIMVARGDLGLQEPFEEIPHLQKLIIRLCVAQGKPVITATQMLESMIENERPTRAEVTDVANAILDGTDAVMLSGETAVGNHPAVVVETMARIATRTEEEMSTANALSSDDPLAKQDSTAAVAEAACMLAQSLGVKAILSFTRSGTTARMVSKFRPSIPIVAATPSKETFGTLTLSCGVCPVLADHAGTIDEMIDKAYAAALDAGYLTQGDRVVITAGEPSGSASQTDLIKVGEVKDPRAAS